MDHKIPLDCDFLMTQVNLLLDPLVEGRTQDRCHYIANPLLRRLGNLELALWKILIDLFVVVIKKLQDLLNTKSFISNSIKSNRSRECLIIVFKKHLLWDVDGLDHLGREHRLPACHEVLQKVDGDIIIRREIHTNICR